MCIDSSSSSSSSSNSSSSRYVKGKGKGQDIAVRNQNHLTATGNHMPYGITQCYLPPSSSDFPTFAPAEACRRDARLSWPRWRLHPKIVYQRNTVAYLRNNQQCHDRDSNQRRESRKSNVLITRLLSAKRLEKQESHCCRVAGKLTLCDQIWHVISRSGEVILIMDCYISDSLSYFLLCWQWYNYKTVTWVISY